MRIARFRQQAARGIGIEGRRGHAGHMGIDTLGQELPRRHSGTFHDAVHNRLAVNGNRKRTPHAHILQRVLAQRLAIIIRDEGRILIGRAQVIKAKEDQAQANRLRKRNAVILAELRQIRCRYLVNEFHIACQQCGSARRIIGDHAIDHALESRTIAPVIVIPFEFNPVTAAVRHYAVRASANRRAARIEFLGRRVLMRLPVQDANIGHVQRHQRMGRRGAEADRQRVHNLNRLDGPRISREG